MEKMKRRFKWRATVLQVMTLLLFLTACQSSPKVQVGESEGSKKEKIQVVETTATIVESQEEEESSETEKLQKEETTDSKNDESQDETQKESKIENVVPSISQESTETNVDSYEDEEGLQTSIVVYFSRAENMINAEAYLDTLGDDVDAMTSASIFRTKTDEITGNIGLLARWIQEKTASDIFSIKMKEQYPQLKKETQQIVLEEQLYGDIPEVEASGMDFSSYDLIYLGFPNWYGEPPRALYSFLEQNDLDGKVIIPFTSDDRNGFSDSVDILKSKLPNAIVLNEEDSLLVNRKDLFDAKKITQDWAEEAKEKAKLAQNDPRNSSAGQKEAAIALIGQTLTSEEIEEKVGKYLKFSKGTNG